MNYVLFFVLMPVFSLGIFKQDSDPLKRAIESGDLQTIIEAKNIDNFTPHLLIYALGQRQYDIAMTLLEKGVRTDVENEEGDTPLIVAMKNHLLTKRMMDKMISNGAVLEHVHQKSGMTAIMYGARSGFIKGIELLTDAGVSLDRINLKDGKEILSYARDGAVFEFLMKSHRYMGKSLERNGYKFVYDSKGFPTQLAMGADGIVYLVKKGADVKIAKFCYKRSLFSEKGVVEYTKCQHDEEQLAKSWSSWFANKMFIENFDIFSIKDYVKGKTLASWMTGFDPQRDFGSMKPAARLARQKLRELLVRMFKAGLGFVGDFKPSNLIFSEEFKEWIVVDGHKAVACYSPSDHEWIWLEYCQASMSASKENLLKAFQSYAIGPSPTDNILDAESFGIWLMSRFPNQVTEGPSALAKEKMIELINSITLSDIQ